ncbi:MAG: ATP-binding cassette domain-containing protein [Bacillota bacterium]|jgi:molybdate transport system ATP-binding protein
MLVASVKKALPDFTLDVDLRCDGGILVLSGPSGAGKTTLLDCIAGLRRPDEGSVMLDGKTLFDASRGIDLPPRRRGIGYVFQNYALFPHMSVRQNVLYPLSIRGRPRRRLRPGAQEVLDMLKINHIAHRYPRDISGGEQQRVALARALMTAPDLLLLDEPWSSLDEETRAVVRDELVRLQRFWRIPFVLVTHDYRASGSMGQLLCLDQGRLRKAGEPILGVCCS